MSKDKKLRVLSGSLRRFYKFKSSQIKKWKSEKWKKNSYTKYTGWCNFLLGDTKSVIHVIKVFDRFSISFWFQNLQVWMWTCWRQIGKRSVNVVLQKYSFPELKCMEHLNIEKWLTIFKTLAIHKTICLVLADSVPQYIPDKLNEIWRVLLIWKNRSLWSQNAPVFRLIEKMES